MCVIGGDTLMAMSSDMQMVPRAGVCCMHWASILADRRTYMHLQGQPDYALASAGGQVVGHSLLAAEGRPRWATVVQRAARLVPGGLLPFVHPHADEVGTALCCLPPRKNLLACQAHAHSACYCPEPCCSSPRQQLM